ncbi:ABC transporter permease [Tannockella kyphosi]|uniref:ABC transporter permease n=1 Tax=Tannockella kyphosi TaxID=2899121 RepID=UPI002010F342|nr:ABC transporter permease [Tannockella kyphosi]
MSKSTMKFIGKRLVIAVITVVVVLAILFLMLKLMPGTPFNDEKLTEAQMAAIYAQYGLDKPIFVQFITYIKNMMSGDFGTSYGISKNYPVSLLVLPRIPISFGIGIAAVIFGTGIGFGLGVFAALHRNTIWDSLATIFAVMGVSVPSFVIGLLLLLVLGVNFSFFPVIYKSSEVIRSSILPVIALSFGVIANIARFTRSEMIAVLGSDYIALAEAKGLDRGTVIRKHAIRNTLIPVITVLGPILVNLMTGSMVLEKIFSIPGLGTLLVTGITVNDYNVVLAVSFVYSLLYVVMMLVIDVSYGIIDPRIRLGKGD